MTLLSYRSLVMFQFPLWLFHNSSLNGAILYMLHDNYWWWFSCIVDSDGLPRLLCRYGLMMLISWSLCWQFWGGQDQDDMFDQSAVSESGKPKTPVINKPLSIRTVPNEWSLRLKHLIMFNILLMILISLRRILKWFQLVQR